MLQTPPGPSLPPGASPQGATRPSHVQRPADNGTVVTPPSTEIGWAELIQKIMWGAAPGSVQQVPDEMASAELNTTFLLDPLKIEAFRDDIAAQLNQQSGGPKIEDLSSRIADVVIDDTAQGAGTLQISLIDPMLTIVNAQDKHGNLFIQADQNGYLWPPIDVNFPGGTQCYWRLCQMSWTRDLTQPNVTLTFEDRIVSILRQMSPATGGVAQGSVNQTLGAFILMLVQSANRRFGTSIQVVELISPQDPNYTPAVTTAPSNPESTLRPNPTKAGQGLTSAQQSILTGIQRSLDHVFSFLGGGTMGSAESQGQSLVSFGSHGQAYYSLPSW